MVDEDEGKKKNGTRKEVLSPAQLKRDERTDLKECSALRKILR